MRPSSMQTTVSPVLEAFECRHESPLMRASCLPKTFEYYLRFHHLHSMLDLVKTGFFHFLPTFPPHAA